MAPPRDAATRRPRAARAAFGAALASAGAVIVTSGAVAQQLVVTNLGGTVDSESVATDPQGGAAIVDAPGPLPLDPAVAVRSIFTGAIGGLFPCRSTAKSGATFGFAPGSPTTPFSAWWRTAVNEYWLCELGVPYLNFNRAAINAHLELALSPMPAQPRTIHYWWRNVAMVRIDPEAVMEDPAETTDTGLRVNGTALFAPGFFDLSPTLGHGPGFHMVIEKGQNGSFLYNPGDVVGIDAQVNTRGQVSNPGMPSVWSILGPSWLDKGGPAFATHYEGAIYLSVDNPIPAGGPPGTGIGLAACPGPGGCYVAKATAGCSDGACCQTVCTIDPFCCNVQWDAVCAAQALQLCPPCPVLCHADDVPELEPCGADSNPGCDAPAGSTEIIRCGDTICGTSWALPPDFDTDWYDLHVADNDGSGVSTITLTVQADFPLTVELHDVPCGALLPLAVLEADPALRGTSASLSVNVAAPADYRLRVLPVTSTSGPPGAAGAILCGVHDVYRISVDVDDCTVVPCIPGPDRNGDGCVDGADLAIVLGSWDPTGALGQGHGPGDANCDGVVDAADAAMVLGAWGLCP